MLGCAGAILLSVCIARCFFGDFMDKAAPGERRYAEIPDVTAALSAIEEALADHNATSKRPMPLAMFLFALEHVSRISRLMKQPGGHMLLVGVGGSGRQSLARLAAFMSGLEVFQVIQFPLFRCICVKVSDLTLTLTLCSQAGIFAACI